MSRDPNEVYNEMAEELTALRYKHEQAKKLLKRAVGFLPKELDKEIAEWLSKNTTW